VREKVDATFAEITVKPMRQRAEATIQYRIVKRKNNIPVLGVCEYCNAEFAADPETIGRPQDAHACIQKQFIAHKCKRLDASQNAVRIVSKGESH